MSYRPSTSPYQFPKSGQAWGQSSQSRIIGASVISTGNSKSAGSANRVYGFLRHKYGTTYALDYFKKTTFGPFVINKNGTGLVWN